jgi:hypothetical protein
MNTRHLTALLCASVLALTACGGAGEQKAESNATNAVAPAAPANDTAATENAAGGEEGGTTAGANQDFTLVNNTGHTVMTLNVSPSDSDEWGPDILGSDVLANGQSAQVSFERGQDQCNWDLRATYDDGDTTDARGVNLCELATVTLTGQ